MASEYRFLFADLKTGSLIGELPLMAASWSEVLNAPGAFQGALPLDHGDPTITPAVFAPAKTRIYVERDGVIVWGGILWALDLDVAANVLNFGCEGFLSYFRRRVFGGSLASTNATYFPTADQLNLARGLIDYAQDSGLFPGGDLGILTPGTATSGVTRERNFTLVEFIGDALERMAAVDNGFDFRFSSAWNGSNEVEVSFLTSYPATGRETEIVFDMGANVALLNYSESSENIGNKVWVTGASSGSLPRRFSKEDASLLGEYPRLDLVASAPGAVLATTLEEHADRSLTAADQPLATVSLEVYPDTVPAFGSYLVGDKVRVKGSHGYLDLDADYRITEIEMAVEGGAERVSLALAPWSLFT